MTTNTRSQFASLYIGDLKPEVGEIELFNFFKKHKFTPANVKVCRDHQTTHSLGYGYANFNTVSEAENALDVLNNDEINGKACRIMWSQRDPALRRSGIGNVYIGNLDMNVTIKELSDTFSQFGNILSCKVALDEKGVSKGYGFVHFESVECSQKAIDKASGFKMGEKEITVSRHVPYRERQAVKANSWTNVFVKNLVSTFTEEELRSLFSPYGVITSTCIKLNTHKFPSNPGEPVPAEQPQLKFGFVNFLMHEEAVRATESLDSKDEQGLKLYVARAQTKHEREEEKKRKGDLNKAETRKKYQNVNLYVKNLEETIDEAALTKAFSKFGKIHSLQIRKDQNGRSAGFGFVCFTTPEEASTALQFMRGQTLDGCTKPLYIAFHQSKEDRARNRFNPSYSFPYPPPYFYGATTSLPYNVNPRATPIYPPPPPGYYGQRNQRKIPSNNSNSNLQKSIPNLSMLPPQHHIQHGLHMGPPIPLAVNQSALLDKIYQILVQKTNNDQLIIGSVISELQQRTPDLPSYLANTSRLDAKIAECKSRQSKH